MQWIPIIPDKLTVITGSVRTGKTSGLKAFSADHLCTGFLTPDSKQGRVFVNLSNHSVHEFEVAETDPRAKLSIGRFHFLADIFSLGNQLIQESVGKASPYFILDEWGLLEAHNQGFSRFNDLLPVIKSAANLTHYLVVVRSSLLGQFKDMVSSIEAVDN